MGTRTDGRRRGGGWAKLGAAIALGMTLMGIGTIPALAHHPIVSSSVSCDERTGRYDVTWTVANGNWQGRSMTLDQSNRAAVPLTTYAPDETKSYQEALPGTTDGATTLTVRADWSDGGPQNVQASASVQTDGSCEEPEPERKHTICHATSSTTNPYAGRDETINPSNAGVSSGHLDHTGPVPTSQAHLEELKDAHDWWGDIIPPFEWEGQTYSLNWTAAGQAIWNNGCSLPEEEPEPGPEPERKHTICHATNSTENPYSGHEATINPSNAGVLNGHLDHTGPVPANQAHLEQLKADQIQWGDIVPPFEWDGQTYSLNWPAGEAIFENGCALPDEDPEPEPEPAPELDIDKEADDGSVDAGDEIGYTVTVSNDGDGTARDVELTDELPDDGGLDWEIEETTGGWDCEIDEGVLTCGGDGFDLEPGDSASVHITSPTTPESCGTVRNRATAEASNTGDDEDGEPDTEGDGSDEGDVDDEVESDVERIRVECSAAIELEKDGPVLAHRGDTITYDFEVTNVGQIDLHDVELSDPNCDGGTIELVDDGDGDDVLSIGETWTYGCTRLVTGGDPDPLPNTGTVRGETPDDDEVSDEDDHVVDLIHPGIRIVKTVDRNLVPVGSTVTYTYVVTNIGDTTLFDVTVTDDVLGPIGTIPTLEPNASVTLTEDFVVGSSPITNVGTAEGRDVLGEAVSDDDDAFVGPILGSGDRTDTPAPSGTPPTTAFTGSDTGGLAAIALGLVVVGLLAIAGAARRRSAERA